MSFLDSSISGGFVFSLEKSFLADSALENSNYGWDKKLFHIHIAFKEFLVY